MEAVKLVEASGMSVVRAAKQVSMPKQLGQLGACGTGGEDGGGRQKSCLHHRNPWRPREADLNVNNSDKRFFQSLGIGLSPPMRASIRPMPIDRHMHRYPVALL